jgi:hypothetical protein
VSIYFCKAIIEGASLKLLFTLQNHLFPGGNNLQAGNDSIHADDLPYFGDILIYFINNSGLWNDRKLNWCLTMNRRAKVKSGVAKIVFLDFLFGG